jgi:pimeloyl-ACP methyl ester carboxylesterase
MLRLILSVLALSFAFSVHAKVWGNHGGYDFCFYPGDPTSTRLVVFFHGYGDNVQSWDSHPQTAQVQKYWNDNHVVRPNVINLSHGQWWYVDAVRATELNGFLAWFEPAHFAFTPERVLYGESMGGHNAYRWALDAPDKFVKLAVACPAFPKFFVKDAQTGPSSGLMEIIANQVIGGAYSGSSLPDFNPLLHSVRENPAATISKVYIVATDIDGFGFYDGDMALNRLLSKDAALSVTWEVQSVNHCEHEATQLAKFLVE